MNNDTHARKEQIQNQLQGLSKKIGEAIAELKERREQRNVLTQHVQEQKIRRKELSKVIKEKIGIVKQLRLQRGDKRERGVPLGKLREEIGRLERKIETSGMAFADEQKLTKIIKEKKAVLNEASGGVELDKQIRTLSREIDNLKKESDEAHEHVTSAAKQSQEHHERMLALSAQLDEWKKEEAQVKETYSKLRDEMAALDIPVKVSRKKQTQEDDNLIAEKVAQVEQKVKDKKKLTTEDLLAFQAQK